MLSGLPVEIGIDLMGILGYPDFRSPNNGCQIFGLGRVGFWGCPIPNVPMILWEIALGAKVETGSTVETQNFASPPQSRSRQSRRLRNSGLPCRLPECLIVSCLRFSISLKIITTIKTMIFFLNRK